MNRSAVVVAVGLTCLATVSAAHQNPSQSQPTFRAAVELVQLDVTVLDKDRHPVKGLAASDFTLLEDGKPQKVLSFSGVDAVGDVPSATTVASAPAWTREVAPDVTTNDLPDGRLFVLLMDDALIPFDPKIIADAKRIGSDVIDHLGPTDRMAVIFTAANRTTQDFTADRAKLRASVESLNPRYASWFLGYDGLTAGVSRGLPIPNLDTDGNFYTSSLQTLRDVIDFLAATPDRRKVLVYVSPGVPIDYDMLSPSLASGTGKGMPNRELHRRLADQLPEMFRRAQRANVAIYAVDPTGLDGLESYVANRLLSIGMGYGGAKAIGHKNATLATDLLNTAAANTGGRVIINTNDFGPGIAAMFEETRSYYLLAYAATDPGSGNMHRLQVKVDRPGLEVVTRHAYYASDAKETAKNAQMKAASPLSAAMSAILPNSGLRLRAVASPFASASSTSATVAIVLNISEPPPLQETTDPLDVQVSAFTPEGTPLGSTHQTLQWKLRAGGTDPMQVELLSHLDLMPGRYQLRIAANSHVSNAVGSVFVDVEIPDFGREPLSLSGVVLDASPRVAVAGKDALANLLPVLPTSERAFDSATHVTAFVRVYQGGSAPLAPVTFTTKVIDAQGGAKVDRQDTIDAASFDPRLRSADQRVAVPLDQLAPGDYLLTIDAGLGAHVVNRSVRFHVR